MSNTKLWTLSAIVSDLEIRLDDVTNTRWSDAQMQLAVKAAVRKSAGQWWDERVDETHTYEDDTFRYSLPPACQMVEEVWFAAEADEPYWQVSSRFWHTEAGQLVFTEPFSKYSGNTMRIVYLVYPNNLLTSTGSGSVSDDTLVDFDATFLTDGVCPGDSVLFYSSGGTFIEECYVADAGPTNTNITLALHPTPSFSGACTYYLAYYTDLPYEYLVYGAMAELYEMSLRNRPGVEVRDAIELATYYRQMAEDRIIKQRKRQKPRYNL